MGELFNTAPDAPKAPDLCEASDLRGPRVAPVATELRNRLALALDVDDLAVAVSLARQLHGYFGVAKIGLELYSAAGPEAIAVIADIGYEIFLDLKLHDIPTTVNKAARVLGASGVRYLTAHAGGGIEMLRAAVAGLSDGAHSSGGDCPGLLAISVLTSDSAAAGDVLAEHLTRAAEAHCQGVVCSVPALAEARRVAPKLMRVTPGIRLVGDRVDDQAWPATPAEAFVNGADLLVIGRSITAADDPLRAARRIHESASKVL